MEQFKNYIYLITFIVLFSLFTTPYINNHLNPSSVVSQITYKVEQGDTLWNIGNTLGFNNISKFVFDVKKVNKLAESEIFVDQIIIIP